MAMNEYEQQRYDAVMRELAEFKREIGQLSDAANERATTQGWCVEYDEWVEHALRDLTRIRDYWHRRETRVNLTDVTLTFKIGEVYVKDSPDSGTFEESLKRVIFEALEATDVSEGELVGASEYEGGEFRWR